MKANPDTSYVTALHAQVPLTLHDPSPRVLDGALKHLDQLLTRDVDKKRITADERDAARSRVRAVEGDLASGSGTGLEDRTDLFIEVRV